MIMQQAEKTFTCPGYKKDGKPIACGIEFKSITRAAPRCPVCRLLHLQEWYRLNKDRKAELQRQRRRRP
jgi:hypothetical protein